MSLSDEIAAKVLGEIYTLTKRIDEQQAKVITIADVVKEAADLIRTNSELSVNNARVATELAQLDSLAHFNKDMSTAVATTLNEVAGAVATKAAVKWIMGGVLLAGTFGVVAGVLGYNSGKDAGNAFGYAQARDEIAAATWANTPNGKMAYRLAKAGSLEYLLNCNRPGWQKENGVCYVYPLKEGKTYGWHLP
jgi:hypothetical protein